MTKKASTLLFKKNKHRLTLGPEPRSGTPHYARAGPGVADQNMYIYIATDPVSYTHLTLPTICSV